MFKNLTAILLCSLVLVGCASKPEVQYTNREVISHPEWPSPIVERQFKVKVVVVNNEVIVGMNYEDNIEYQMYEEDILRYVKDLKSTLCFYRTTLKEPECESVVIKK